LLRMISFMQPGDAPRRAREGADSAARPAAPQATRASAPVEAPVRVSSATAPTDAPAFDGDWPALVERLNLTGMAGMVARHGELVSYDNGHFELRVPESHRMYAEKAYQDKLKGELQQHFGPTLRLTVKVGATAGVSVAAARSREAAQKQAVAAEAIEDDPFVRDLVRDLGAEVVSSSIRPADDPAGSTNAKR